MKHLFAFFCFATMTATSAAQAQMYKCVEGGHTTYQAIPCAKVATQQSLRVQNISAKEIERTIEFMSTYQACADGMSIWRAEMSGLYSEWRARNAAIVTRIEQDTKFREKLQERIEDKHNGMASMCRPVALELRGVKE